MHPAKSVIFFTTASGAGYGLLSWFVMFDLLGYVPDGANITVVALGLAFALIIGGLLSSTLHLGHPERAWRALSQWRTSWLSREGVAAVGTFVPTGLYGLERLFGSEATSAGGSLLGFLGVFCCLGTVYCTAMIYASLKPIRAWYNKWTVINYLSLSVMTGLLLYLALAGTLGFGDPWSALVGMCAVVIAAVLKMAYWRFVDSSPSQSTTATATGLNTGTSVRLLEAPHSQANYLMKEMVFQVARKHAGTLRIAAIVAGFVLPVVLTGLWWASGNGLGGALGVLSALCAGAGVYTERWLFFAEAKHTVALYYGAQSV